MKKYILVPGYIGTEFYSAIRLRELYGVDMQDCEVYSRKRPIDKLKPGQIWLTPRLNGDYTLPQEEP